MKMKFAGSRSITALLIAICLAVLSARADVDVSAGKARPAPAWLRDGIVYEIFPRAFSANGDLAGVTARLDELKDLGVDVLWLMPIHPIGEKFRKGALGSPYAISDYYAIDPHCGTTNDLKELVAAAHTRGLKVIMDIVANHTAWDSVMMTHPEFYKQDNAGKVIPPVPEWTDVAGLNYASPALREYMIAMLKHYVTDFDVDGFRCDVAYMVPTDFWEQARAELEKIKPGLMMLAEASKPELFMKAFDLDYSWPLLGKLGDVLLHGASATELQHSWEESRRQFPQGSLHLRISDDHDETRAVAKFGLRGALAAQVLMFTLDGVPLIYNGMEVGDATESGDPALFEKLPIFWHPKERPPMRKIYRGLIQLRKAHAAFRNLDVTWLKNSHQDNVVTFLRGDDREQFLVVINFSSRSTTVKVEAASPSEFQPVKISGADEPPSLDGGSLRLGGYEWRIYRRALPM